MTRGLANIMEKRPLSKVVRNVGEIEDIQKMKSREEAEGVGLYKRIFTYKKSGTGEWDEDVGKYRNIRTVGVKVSEEKLGVFSSAIAVTNSDISKGWNWVLQLISDVLRFRKVYGLRTIGLERAILITYMRLQGSKLSTLA